MAARTATAAPSGPAPRSSSATAKCFSNWVTVQNSGHGPKIGSAGSYTDDMVKQDGQWLFRYRKIDRFIHDKA